ncbi:ABC transporter ATP-binding protein [Roseinatronobacter alkalisoli]|uniref:ATP-binding cassette domain-containing protein n=1 Tax=Roseinatronobacter alkalisoli TaxID=3028235 RepID=A0ABT5T750_9RHOB|nr:ATP-binding cassette domain-containing protein [Roseinatronobacter sp. HJB301]MDD7970958.1 ATP-binding cassette domain-containing protein [Roseinatronobacter sp. HJB301]
MSALKISDMVGRHGLLQAVKGLSLDIPEGETLAVIGANGAGKTTMMRMIAGLHPVAEGEIALAGTPITQMPAHARLKAGIAMSPEGRRLFEDMSVRENLMIAAENGRRGDWTLASVCDAFGQITPLLDRAAGGLSGGQRQAVAIGRALVANPSVLLLDEVSLGLSPAAVEGLYQSLEGLKGHLTMIVVEQDLTRAMAFADRIICLAEGIIELDGKPQDLTRQQITDAYFGIHKTPEGGHA